MKIKTIVKDQIEINAPIAKVWEVLTQTEYYRQWDELPDFSAEVLSKGDVVGWAGYSRMTVAECKENEALKLDSVSSTSRYGSFRI